MTRTAAAPPRAARTVPGPASESVSDRKVGYSQAVNGPGHAQSWPSGLSKPYNRWGAAMKSTFTAFVSRTLARAAGTLRQYVASKNWPEQSADSTATEHQVRRNLPN